MRTHEVSRHTPFFYLGNVIYHNVKLNIKCVITLKKIEYVHAQNDKWVHIQGYFLVQFSMVTDEHGITECILVTYNNYWKKFSIIYCFVFSNFFWVLQHLLATISHHNSGLQSLQACTIRIQVDSIVSSLLLNKQGYCFLAIGTLGLLIHNNTSFHILYKNGLFTVIHSNRLWWFLAI